MFILKHSKIYPQAFLTKSTPHYKVIQIPPKGRVRIQVIENTSRDSIKYRAVSLQPGGCESDSLWMPIKRRFFSPSSAGFRLIERLAPTSLLLTRSCAPVICKPRLRAVYSANRKSAETRSKDAPRVELFYCGFFSHLLVLRSRVCRRSFCDDGVKYANIG